MWAEPATVEQAAWEFADTEKMIEAAEALYGPYRWGRYDLLIMPPAFPLGGMENPRLTFASPTVIAGDRSMVSLVAHELAHSWSGNLVTNATWNDLWLNEGFTVYFERRILEALYGRAYSELEADCGRQKLEASLDARGMSSRDTWLHQDLSGRDPDESLSEVPYEKGYLFLRRLEEVFGRETFDAFVRGHFEAHAFQSLDTAEFLVYLEQVLLSQDPAKAAQVGVNAWVYGPGLPENAPRAVNPVFDGVEALARAWVAGEEALSAARVAGWGAAERIHFLESMPPTLSAERMAQLEAVFGLKTSQNSEMMSEWLKLTILADYRSARPKMKAYLLEVGRGRFIRPLYQALAGTPEGRREALEIFAEARPGYHSMTRASLERMLAREG